MKAYVIEMFCKEVGEWQDIVGDVILGTDEEDAIDTFKRWWCDQTNEFYNESKDGAIRAIEQNVIKLERGRK